MESEADIGDRIQEFIQEEVLTDRVAAIEEDTPLLTGVLDSFGLVQIVSFLEEEFGIEVGAADMSPDHFGSLTGIKNLVRQRMDSPQPELP